MIIYMIWTANLAYVVGLIASDGSLSKDGRHIEFTSKDLEQVQNFKKALNLKNKIGRKYRGWDHENYCYRIGFGNIKFYKFLLSIGLSPNKSKTIKKILVPDKYFVDYLRGEFDGDGYSSSYWSKQWKSSFILYLGFSSSSYQYLIWLQKKITKLMNYEGAINKCGKSGYQLMFAKYASIAICEKIYYSSNIMCLKRKRYKLEDALCIIQQQAGMLKLVYRHV